MNTRVRSWSPIEAQAVKNYAAAPIPQIPASQFAVKGGLTYAGVNGQPAGLYNVPKLDFAPRIGRPQSGCRNCCGPIPSSPA